MRCSCEHEGNFPINIIQGDSYRRAYTFYDKNGEVITAEHIGVVYWNCARLKYQQELKYNVEDSSWIFYLSSTETADFAYCKTTYDLTLYFTDEQVETEIYSSELRILEKKNKPSAGSYSGGEPFDTNSITTNIYTGLILTAGGGGTNNHATLINRDMPNQHPISAITGLEEALDGKQPSGDYATTQELDELTEIVEGKADADNIPTKTSELENDSGFIISIPSEYVTDSELASALQDVRDDIPTKTSDIENDSDFVDQTYVDGIGINLQGQIDDLQAEKMPLTEIDTVPTEGSSNLVESGGVYDAIDGVQQDIDTINNKIPAQASSSNQLADKAFVNSTIQTATANFRGNWNHWSEVPTDSDMYPVDYAGSKIPTTNDYLVIGDASDYTLETLNGAWRFKYSGTWATNGKNGWHPEYLVNETPLTMAQLDALNSGVTAQKVADYDSHIADKSNPHGVTYQQLGGTNPSYTKTESDNKYALKDEGGGMIVIDYADLGVAPYTFAEVKALLENGQDVRVKTNSYMPHCTSYSDSIITFFDITSWDLGAGVYSITYIHLRNTNDKYKYTETEPLNPVVYARIAPNYSDSADYTVGDYCTRYENVYRCTTPILGGEEWNSAHWTVVTVMGEVVNKQDKLIAGDNITIENNIISATGGGDSAFIIDYNNPVTTDYENAVANFTAGGVVRFKKDNIALPMTGYDATHCYFGGTVSAYLPAGYVIAVYAHIGTNGQNYFWYQYQSTIDGAQKPLVVTITQGGGLSNYSADKTNAEIYAAWQAGREVIASINGGKIPCLQANETIAYFVLPMGGEDGVTYATISTMVIATLGDTQSVTVDNSILQSSAIADTAGYYTTDTVEGALAEIGAKLAAYPSEIWEGGDY